MLIEKAALCNRLGSLNYPVKFSILINHQLEIAGNMTHVQ